MLLFRFFSFSAVVRTGCHWQTNTFICRGYFGFYLVEDWVLDLRGEYRWRAYLVFSLYFVLIVPTEKLSYLSASSFGLNFIFLVYAGDDYRLCELVFSGFFVICLEIYILTSYRRNNFIHIYKSKRFWAIETSIIPDSTISIVEK